MMDEDDYVFIAFMAFIASLGFYYLHIIDKLTEVIK